MPEPVNIEQRILVKQFQKYLESKDRDIGPSDGYCNGLSTLWLNEMVQGPDRESAFFDRVTRIAQWDGVNTPESDQDFESLIGEISFLQEPGQVLPELSQNTAAQNIAAISAPGDRVINDPSYDTADVFTDESLTEFLRSVPKDETLIRLTLRSPDSTQAHGHHAVAIYVQDGSYYMYDANIPRRDYAQTGFDDPAPLVDVIKKLNFGLDAAISSYYSPPPPK